MKPLVSEKLSLTKNLPCFMLQALKKEVILFVASTNLCVVLRILKLHINYQFRVLTAITGVDLLVDLYRFSLVYDLLSLTFNSRLRLKILLTDIMYVNSIISIFINANWWEREIWDLYGIYFLKHPDLRRLLTDYGFEGYPMRKDFPLYGNVELYYNEKKQHIIVEPLQLTQEFRLFNIEPLIS